MAGPEAWWQRAKEEIGAAHELRATGKRVQAYHHAGQAIEFALKAIYMKRKGLSDWPAAYKGATWHSLPHIAHEAGLDGEVAALRVNKADRGKYQNWLTVRGWDSNGRFPGNTPSVKEINDLMLAIVLDAVG